MLECLAAVSRDGDGWLWKPESPSALPFHAQEDRWRDELWVPPGSPHGLGAPLSGRRKVTHQRQVFLLSPLLQKMEQCAVYLIFLFFFFNNIWMHKDVFCCKW